MAAGEVGPGADPRATQPAALDGSRAGVWEVVRCTLPSALIPIVAGVVLCGLPQGLEAFRVIVEDMVAGTNRMATISLFATTAAAAVTAWYCARVMLYLFLPRAPVEGAVAVLPRIWGMIPGAAVAIAYLMVRSNAETSDRRIYLGYAAISAVLSLVLYLAFVLRRQVIRSMAEQGRATEVFARASENATQQGLSGLRWPTWGPLAFIAGASALLCICIIAQSGAHLAGLTTPGVVMFSVASWVMAITWILYESKRTGRPILTYLAIAAVVFAAFNLNEDHEVRKATEARNALRLAPVGADSALDQWLATRGDRGQYPDGYPVFIVAAEGGGIRAAMTAALVMGYLSDVCPAFPVHTFAVSGVSGGSIGLAAFVALLRHDKPVATTGPCRMAPDAFPLTKKLADFASVDYLTPALATTLYPDVAGWILPFGIARIDRARALELAFARGFRTSAASDTGDFLFEHSFLGNSEDTVVRWRPSAPVPALIFNTTRVETGERVLVSQIELPDTGIAHALTMYDIDSSLDLRLSTAATLSARFPVVSPEGVVRPQHPDTGEPRLFRFVDGGYYDNSGLVTAMTLAAFVHQRHPEVIPVIIRIGYDIRPANAAAARWGPSPGFDPWAEALSPVRAVLDARDAHTASQLAALERLRQATAAAAVAADSGVPAGACRSPCTRPRRHSIVAAELLLEQEKVPYILGWLISRAAVDRAQGQLKPPTSCDASSTTSQAGTPPHAQVGEAATVQASPQNDKNYCAIAHLLEGTPDATLRTLELH